MQGGDFSRNNIKLVKKIANKKNLEKTDKDLGTYGDLEFLPQILVESFTFDQFIAIRKNDAHKTSSSLVGLYHRALGGGCFFCVDHKSAKFSLLLKMPLLKKTAFLRK